MKSKIYKRFFLFFNVKRMVNKVQIETLIFHLVLKLKYND